MIVVDGHVHIQPGFMLNDFLYKAWKNFFLVSQQPEKPSPECSFVLLLTEAGGHDVFSSLITKIKKGYEWPDGEWQFMKTKETNSLIAVKGEKAVVVIAGSQLVSSENIELPSLFFPLQVKDNVLSLTELAVKVSEHGGIPLLPWGVGKWLGQRGKVVQAFLDSPPVPLFLVGDNGNRPKIWPYPQLLALAEEKGVGSLAGSDPLRFTNHDGRAGVRGGILSGVTLSSERPAGDLQALFYAGSQIKSYGRGVGVGQFLYDQLRANLVKRR